MKKLFYTLVTLVVFGYALSNCGSSETNNNADSASEKIINLNQIAKKPLAEVERVIGKGEFLKKVEDKRANCGDCPKYSFKNGDIDIVFINGVADWITIHNMGEARFVNCSIDLLGDFDCANRDAKTDAVMRWNNLKGFREISFFQKFSGPNKPSGKIDYAYIKTDTE